MENKIYLIPIGSTEQSVLEVLDRELEKAFSSGVERHEKMGLPQDAFDPRRNQYFCPHIMNTLRSFIELENEGDKVLGIADVDLYVSGLNFVFGQAELGGHFAVISLTRLRQSYYGLPEDTKIFQERTIKEAVHELGHVHGLEHCPESTCVMHFSNSLDDTDRKSTSFCSRCQGILKSS
ncbi:MAG: archaemetzincin family Zn-dependent metalloprotease [Candidatus Aminicenantes bacterium]|nr:MAG: archaemetzincin family Zn-dependent metalloprotease [Candidatus Aminicenantes bacterium]